MRQLVEDYKYHLLVAVLLIAGSGCAGAVMTTADQLSKEAVSPITVPVEQYGKAKNTLNQVNQKQTEQNQEIEATK